MSQDPNTPSELLADGKPDTIRRNLGFVLIVAMLLATAIVGDALFLRPPNESPPFELPSWSEQFTAFGNLLPFVDRCVEYYSQFSGIPGKRLQARATFYGASFLLGFFAS